MPAFLWTADLVFATPPLILAAASAPAALLTALILFAQRGERRPYRALGFALLWGAVGAACLATIGNEYALAHVADLAGYDARSVTSLLVAPALEEVAKALGLVVLLVLAPASLRSARDGIVYGALIGAGFVWTENFLYLGVSMLQGGEGGLIRGLYLRGIVGGATHIVFTACSGAALGWWMSRAGQAARGWRGSAAGRFMLAAGGLLSAIAQHVAWNGLAAPLIVRALCGAAGDGSSCTDEPTVAALFGATTLIAGAFLAPGAALVALAGRSARFRANRDPIALAAPRDF